ncbi:MAG: isoleucine--tRNA ligase [Planctomycetota bacterium]|nr:isoleucine--tRNA ligase [Planctomycetota bacterium]
MARSSEGGIGFTKHLAHRTVGTAAMGDFEIGDFYPARGGGSACPWRGFTCGLARWAVPTAAMGGVEAGFRNATPAPPVLLRLTVLAGHYKIECLNLSTNVTGAKEMNYKDTINLPKTDFAMKADLVKREPELHRWWAEVDIYRAILNARRAAPKYVLHDGPPYANGEVHIGTGINKILKDIVVKYKTMRGFETPYVPGWDCHGQPIEHKVVTQLGRKAQTTPKAEIREMCKKYAESFIDIQRRQFKRLGVFGEWERPYLTFDPTYEASVLELFADLVEKGHVYRKLKPVHWCMSCRTALAEAELEYGDEKGPSIYVRFPLRTRVDKLFGVKLSDPGSVMIWTTTPWTLPANVATALHPQLNYALVKYESVALGRPETTIVAAPTVERVFGALGIKNFEVLGTAEGKALNGTEYTHPFINRTCPIVMADYVRVEDGTGCVHTAPGHGQEDYATGIEYNLPVLSPVDPDGRFTQEAEVFVGMNVFDADQKICKLLADNKTLLRQEEITHSYPHCWRCKKPVIFRATEQWFIAVDHANAREKALAQVAKTKWYPEWGEVRISGMLRERPDWCISRQRTWGVPIPAVYCQKCGKPFLTAENVRRTAAIFAKEGASAWFLQPASYFHSGGAKCEKCGGAEFRKEDDIFDVWFESGASHRAVVMKHEALSFPADLYLEGTDQHRGWFQLSLLPTVMSQGVAPFRAVLTHGFVVDEEGDKLSKSKAGGLLQAEELTDKYGADVLRLWTSSVNFTDDIPVSHKVIQERAEPYMKIRNTFRYLLGNLFDFDPTRHTVPLGQLHEIDRWALSRLQNLIRRVTSHYERFEFYRAYHDIYNFCVVEMSAFYLDIAKDRLYCSGADWTERRGVQTVLGTILDTLTRLVAPVLVHTAEEIWRNTSAHKKGSAAGSPGEVDSVHIATWPTVDPELVDVDLETRWDRLVKVRTDVLRELERLRKEKTIGSSLEANVTLHADDEKLYEFLKGYEKDLPMVFIVSNVKLGCGLLKGSTPGVEVQKLSILAKPSEHKRCERCWNRRDTVGKDTTHPALCARCVRAV